MSHWKLSSQCPQIVCQRCFRFVLGPLDRLPGFLRRLSIQLSFSHSKYAEEGICSHRRMGIQGEWLHLPSPAHLQRTLKAICGQM